MNEHELTESLQTPSIMRRKVDQHISALLAEERALRIVHASRIEQVEKELARFERRLVEAYNQSQKLAEEVRNLAERVTRHADLEEEQWKVVNKGAEHLEALGETMNQHLTANAAIQARISWIERIMFGMFGVVASLLIASAAPVLNWWLR